MPQVFVAASSPMLLGVKKTGICFDALCVNRNAFPDFILIITISGKSGKAFHPLFIHYTPDFFKK
ncbi:hypothetical protein T11_16035 [Trichinella zimbabwensis]|uniref:Uncharacterized protein n=1 Tax=Trichinella zimbabwensis TaxID=268475 RepID=A0A0V1H3B1_9BILA|nr:hypothetical protein T11_3250 [Trichinella zimbabwensis]KRZ00346.1 hypothetical protein T11_12076 [Trichinella zimbabwensis]KRZ04596.1 hypothetical protein T11_16035 [Trichinella zimbabwensis]